MEKQITSSEHTTKDTGVFTALGMPDKIIVDGEDITKRVLNSGGGINGFLRGLAIAFRIHDTKAFALSRINGVVKLYLGSN